MEGSGAGKAGLELTNWRSDFLLPCLNVTKGKGFWKNFHLALSSRMVNFWAGQCWELRCRYLLLVVFFSLYCFLELF